MSRIPRSLAVALLPWLAVPPVQADLGDELFKLLASDGEQEDSFGVSVAISGNVAIIGAYRDSGDIFLAGSAYLFDLTTRQQLFKLLPNDPGQGDTFGRSVAIDGNIAIVGANGDDDNAPDAGAAYLFDVTTGQQIAKLLASDGAASDYFGWSVAISGNRAVVGAWRDDNPNGNNVGSAYVFDVSTGEQLWKLIPDVPDEAGSTGWSVAISNDVILVGSPGGDYDGIHMGTAHLFDAATGQQLHTLAADDAVFGKRFGESVAIDGTTAIVGARDGDKDNAGSAYLFDTATGRQLAKLEPDDPAAGDRFGSSVDIRGLVAVVGAPRVDDSGIEAGSAYLFDVATGEQIAQLLTSDRAARDHTGFSVALGEGLALVGVPDDDNGNGFSAGSAYVFDAAGCLADLDGDGDADADDFFTYLDLFAADDPRADIDGNGTIDADDFFAYLDLFAAGCD